MNLAYAVCLALLVVLAGCAGLTGDADPATTVELVVQNDGPGTIDYHVTLTDANGTVVSDELDRLDPGVGQGYDLSVDGDERHELVVRTNDWSHTFQVDPNTCEAYEVTLRILDGGTQTGGGCVTLRE